LIQWTISSHAPFRRSKLHFELHNKTILLVQHRVTYLVLWTCFLINFLNW
jgi:hypothetical protein